tara:strand:- start:1240 stop:1788 length:549 start_codon:yes stop_codon:yes gene_type:complete
MSDSNSELLKRIQLLKKNAKRKTPSQRRLDVRRALWPKVEDDALWLRKKNDGFTTIPRAFPIINRIMDKMSGKGFPLSSTYLVLWCHVFDEAYVEIKSPREFAFESGFGGTRAESTWITRMRKLKELGFIDSKAGASGEFHYVLIMNPILTIQTFYLDSERTDDDYTALVSKTIQVGDFSLV